MLVVLSHSVVSNSVWPHGLEPTGPWGFSRQEYWSGLPCPPPGDLPNTGIEPRSPTLQVDCLLSEPPGKPKEILFNMKMFALWVLAVQGLGLCLPIQGCRFDSWSGSYKARIPQALWPNKTKQSTKEKQYCNKFSKDFQNGLHLKKKIFKKREKKIKKKKRKCWL